MACINPEDSAASIRAIDPFPLTPAELHEQHKAAVLAGPREHHDEERERIVAEALEQAAAALDKLVAALKVLGK